MKTFFRKVALEVLNVIFFNRVALYVYRRLALVDAVFVMYPATAKYADHFTFRWRQRRIRWSPFLIGYVKHPNEKVSLMFAISATEAHIHEPSYGENVREMYASVDRVRERVNARTSHFAGTLPSVLNRLRVRRPNNEQRATVENVLKAVSRIRSHYGHTSEVPVVIIGSNGYVGRVVAQTLAQEGVKVLGVDIGDEFPSVARSLVLNISRPEAINGVLDVLGEGKVLLNEVYPPPPSDIIEALKEKGVPTHHIVGVHAESVPPFPGAYHGGAPCCAALPGVDYHVLIKEL